jgi:hypothetical protein
MKRIGIGTALLAAVISLAALSATSVAAAAGGPEYLACGKVKKNKTTKKYTGHYKNKLCSEVSVTNEGAYEHVAAKFPIKTSVKKLGETSIYLYNPVEHKNEAEVPCTGGSESGSIINSGEETLTITYTGCVVPTTLKTGKTAQDPGPCKSPGKASGEVVTEPLVTKLVWLDEAETVPGVLVEAAMPGGTFQEAECGGGLVKVKTTGALLAKITPANELTKLLTLTFNATLMTGEPEFGGYWEGAVKTEVKLFSEIKGPVEKPAVPTSEVSTIPQKTGKVLVS